MQGKCVATAALKTVWAKGFAGTDVGVRTKVGGGKGGEGLGK